MGGTRFVTDREQEALLLPPLPGVGRRVAGGEQVGQVVRLVVVPATATFEEDLGEPSIEKFGRRLELPDLERSGVVDVVADTAEQHLGVGNAGGKHGVHQRW